MPGNKPRLSPKAFDAVVTDAIARIPLEIRKHLENILVVVEKRPDPFLLEEAGFPPDELLFGLYLGVPLTERSVVDPPLYPDTIYIFQEPLEDACATREELIEEIEITVAHEMAHALGMDDDDLERLGYG